MDDLFSRLESEDNALDISAGSVDLPQNDRTWLNARTSDTIHNIINETGFSCGSCWEYMESSYCENCKSQLDIYGQAVEQEPEVDFWYLEELEKRNSKQQTWVSWTVHVQGMKIPFTNAKTHSGRLRVRLHMHTWIYRVEAYPGRKEKIHSISGKSSKWKWKRQRVSDQTYTDILSVVRAISSNPGKYHLEKLKVFSH